MQALEALSRSLGAAAVKACGIAGGAVLALANRGNRAHLEQQLVARGVRILPCDIDVYGVHLRKA